MRIKLKKIKNGISYILNLLIPCYSNRIYVRCMKNSIWDKYDILNYGSSNLLSYLNYYIHQPHDHVIVLYIEFFDMTRFDKYIDLSKVVAKNNVKLVFIKSPWITNRKSIKLIYRLKNAIIRFSSRLWFSETGDTAFSGKLWYQKIICFNYFISCKNDLEIGNNYRWKYIDKYLTTGLLPAQIISSSTGVKLDHCVIKGFPRNDTLICSDKHSYIINYYSSILGYIPKKIIVYAPTMRDYEMHKKQKRPLFGYECDWLEKYMKDNKLLLIYKLHPWQNKEVVISTKNIIPYESNYDFSFYDILSVSDALISDYSSIAFDYLLLDKQLIYNLYDLNKYTKSRGLSYDPYLYFCPGHVSTNSHELKKALNAVISDFDEYKEHREQIRKLIYKNPGLATQNVYEFLVELTEK